MPRIIVTVTAQTDFALNKESDKTGAPKAAIVRKAIDAYLKALGYKANSNVAWGGYRKQKE